MGLLRGFPQAYQVNLGIVLPNPWILIYDGSIFKFYLIWSSLRGSWLCTHQCQSQSYFTTGGLPPISSSWSQTPWNPRPENSFFKWTLTAIGNFLSDEKLGLSSYEYAWPSGKCTFRTCNMLLKIISFALHTVPLPVETLQRRSCLSYVSHATTAA
jgi:hypothetical protein